ncbi:glycosyltransferase family 4 protein [Clostridium perfringens]|nr:glycosyltransferase family 4 protein [Clostridium perfringens]
MNKSITFISQFPKPVNGLTKAVNNIYCYMKENTEYTTKKIEINNNKKFINHLINILNDNSKIHYYSPSSSKFGNIRDLIYISISILKKKRVILHFHNNFYGQLCRQANFIINKWNLWMLSKCECCIVLGENHKRMLNNLVDKNKVKIVNNGIDNNYILNKSEFEKKISNKKKTKILYLSNFLKSKGYLEVVKIAETLLANDNFEFIMCGKFYNENDEKSFLKYIEENNLKNIYYKGAVYGKEKENILKEVDIFILITSYKNEVQPISIIEAMGCGNYIISTDIGVISEMLEPTYGALVENNKEAINSILNFTRNKNGIKNSINKVKNNYSLNKYNNSLLEIFESEDKI